MPNPRRGWGLARRGPVLDRSRLAGRGPAAEGEADAEAARDRAEELRTADERDAGEDRALPRGAQVLAERREHRVVEEPRDAHRDGKGDCVLQGVRDLHRYDLSEDVGDDREPKSE